MNKEIPKISHIPIYLFFWVTGTDNNINAKEVETFQRLMNSSKWCKSLFLTQLMGEVCENYSYVWNAYQSGNLLVDIGVLWEMLIRIQTLVEGDERNNLEIDLRLLCKAIARSSGGVFGFWSENKQKRQAVHVVDKLIRETFSRDVMHRKNEPSIITRNSYDDSFWDRGLIRLRCVAVIDEAFAVKTFRFVADCGRHFSYSPGQFITLLTNINSKKVSRVYTISSTPTRPYTLEITVKAIDNGLVSTWLHNNITIGSTIDVNGPGGHFTCDTTVHHKHLMLSAGSGVTPVMSMCRWLYDIGSDDDIVFLHSNRNEKDVPFYVELLLLTQRMNKFRFAITLSGQTSDSWSGGKGRISKDYLLEQVPDILDRQIYLCGPDVFRSALENILDNIGVDFSNYHHESFGRKPNKPRNNVESNIKSIVNFTDSDISSEISEGESILDCAESAGIEIQNSCRSGVCGSCRVRVKSGDAVMLCENALNKSAADNGYILACVTTTKNDIEIEV